MLLQEAGRPPGYLEHLIPDEYEDGLFPDSRLNDCRSLVVRLSDRVWVEPFRTVAPVSGVGENSMGVSGIGTIAAARVVL